MNEPDSPTEGLEAELDRHDAFERMNSDFSLRTTNLDTAVSWSETQATEPLQLDIEVSFPSLDALVADESVPAVVEDGWYETFTRRIEDVYSVARTDRHASPTVHRRNQRVTVELSFQSAGTTSAVKDAKALIEYVEGTFAQGLIPGYTYRGVAADIEANALDRGKNTE